MICPKCKELGLKSRVTGGAGFSTLMYCPPYYDEEGLYHNHDLNYKTAQYSCSNGHRLTVSLSNKCANCDFGHEETIVVQDIPRNNTVVTTNINMIGIDTNGNVISPKGE